MKNEILGFNNKRLLLIIFSIFFSFPACGLNQAFGSPNGNRSTIADFDGDGKSDISVYRPSSGYWYIAKSSGGYSSVQWGMSSDTPVAGDYDGDGKTDLAVRRMGVINQSNRDSWYILKSSDNSYIVREFGENGGFTFSMPTAPVDYDGDGKTDMAVVKRFATSIPFPIFSWCR